MRKKLWYESSAALKEPLIESFNASFKVDRELMEYDIAGSIAYADALMEAGVLSGPETARLKKQLLRLKKELPSRVYSVLPEDVHTAVETALAEKLGKNAGRIHTGRSRNEQVVSDERLYLKDRIAQLDTAVRLLQMDIIRLAEKHAGVIMPSYTHLQQAQPVLFGFYMMSWFFMLQRDRERLADCLKRTDVSPYGSGAVAGNSYGINRQKLAKKLGFSRISENALDAVSDRDFIAEYLSACAILMMHLSRFCEDLIIWSSNEFGFVQIAEGPATSSSLMPQKHNPDALELIRGKAGSVYGNLVGLLTAMKGIPSGYNKDMQEDKEPLFRTARTAEECVQVFSIAVKTMKLYPGRMRQAVNSYTLATDIADYLVRKGVPFRQAHGIVSRLVRYALACKKPLDALTMKEFKKFSGSFGTDVNVWLDPVRSIERKNVSGGTASAMLAKQIKIAKEKIRQ